MCCVAFFSPLIRVLSETDWTLGVCFFNFGILVLSPDSFAASKRDIFVVDKADNDILPPAGKQARGGTCCSYALCFRPSHKLSLKISILLDRKRSTFKKMYVFYFICLSVLPACVWGHHLRAYCLGDQKKVSSLWNYEPP